MIESRASRVQLLEHCSLVTDFLLAPVFKQAIFFTTAILGKNVGGLLGGGNSLKIHNYEGLFFFFFSITLSWQL